MLSASIFSLLFLAASVGIWFMHYRVSFTEMYLKKAMWVVAFFLLAGSVFLGIVLYSENLL